MTVFNKQLIQRKVENTAADYFNSSVFILSSLIAGKQQQQQQQKKHLTLKNNQPPYSQLSAEFKALCSLW